MCLILDANRFSAALSTPPKADYRPIIDWLTAPNSTGMVVYGGTKFLREIAWSEPARRWFLQLQRAGRAKLIDRAVVDAEEQAVRARGLCISDDEHLIALARKSGARVFCSEDKDLWKDVRNPCYRSRVVAPTARSVTLPCSVITLDANARHEERDDPSRQGYPITPT